MKKYPVIANFDGAKFAARYGLSSMRGEFFIDADGQLNVPDTLPDTPPVQEVCDPPKPPIAARLDSVKALPDLIAILKERLT